MYATFSHVPAGAAALKQVLPERSVLCAQPAIGNQQFLLQALQGYRLVIVGNALDATRCHNHSVFDAYVLDYWLPDWSGTALCRDIRKNDPHARAHVSG
jgi:DNA-binding response OmpR family regulator